MLPAKVCKFTLTSVLSGPVQSSSILKGAGGAITSATIDWSLMTPIFAGGDGVNHLHSTSGALRRSGLGSWSSKHIFCWDHYAVSITQYPLYFLKAMAEYMAPDMINMVSIRLISKNSLNSSSLSVGTVWSMDTYSNGPHLEISSAALWVLSGL